MCPRQQSSHYLRGSASIHEIVDDKHAAPGAPSTGNDCAINALEDLEFSLLGRVSIAGYANRLDQPHVELTCDNCSWHQSTPRDAYNCFERAGLRKSPSKSTRIPMKLIPRDRKCFLR